MSSDDYLHAYEQLMHLNLKKTQEREIVRVVLQCCLAEKSYNHFYQHLSTRLLSDVNFKYTFKHGSEGVLKIRKYIFNSFTFMFLRLIICNISALYF